MAATDLEIENAELLAALKAMVKFYDMATDRTEAGQVNWTGPRLGGNGPQDQARKARANAREVIKKANAKAKTR